MSASWEVMCTCGHIYDEHALRGGECDVDGCDCICFEKSR